jgi:NADH dehydrogenase [ubiquinone] 1 alpha subcomplex assembly factor 7
VPNPEINLTDLLKKRISAHGPIDLGTFMYEALQHPQFGYYNRPVVLGGKGDFITAPEISQVFGELIGLWLLERWQSMSKPKSFALVELGPGNGTLMSDILRAAKLVPDFIDSMELHLVESSQSLQLAQADKLANFSPTWHQDITSLPQKPTLIVANEYFDALPIHQFAKTDEDDWREILVGLSEEDTLSYVMSEKVDAKQIQSLGADPKTLEAYDFVEVSPATMAQATLLGDHIQKVGGTGLFVDYGYRQAEGYNSFQAVKQHQKHEPLTEVGTADLTAHVDFQALSKAFHQRGLLTFGPIEQGEFLPALGLEERLSTLVQKASAAQEQEVRQGVARLVDSDQMGQLFKVLAVSSLPTTPAGFLN